MAVEVRPDDGTAAESAARYIAECARYSVTERGRFTVALSGGRTPGRMLAVLARQEIDWQAVHVFQVDERVAPAGDPERNATQLQEILLAESPLANENLHPMPVEASDLDDAAARYAQVLQCYSEVPPVLDLVHLGLGEDGHTASLIPGDAVVDVTDLDVALTDPYRGHRRMTLTLPVLNRARHRLWLVTGEGKAEMLARLRAGDGSIPAGRVRRENSVVFTDVDVLDS